MYITCICNTSLQEGQVPKSQRSATVMPRLKKAGSNQADVQNYRPISNLTFMSKVVDNSSLTWSRWTSTRAVVCLQAWSTETADLKIISDFLAAADRGEVTLISLLDLSCCIWYSRSPNYSQQVISFLWSAWSSAILYTLLGRGRPPVINEINAERFQEIFEEKMASVRVKTESAPARPCPWSFGHVVVQVRPSWLSRGYEGDLDATGTKQELRR